MSADDVSIMRWEEPPEHGNRKPRGPSKFLAVADALRANPNVWAVIRENISPGTGGGLVYRIKSGVGPFAPARSFEAKCVGPAGGSASKVYARYVGEPS